MNRAHLPLREANPTPVQPTYRRLGWIGGWLMRRLTRQDWGPADNLPATGGVIVVANHISNFDPPALAHFLIWNGRWPRTLGKADLWKVPVIGWLATQCGQIPVERHTVHAGNALVHAEEALERGECVLIYPEGTITADPDGWPMTAHPGAARLALRTGCPLVPVGQWGAQHVMGGKQPRFPKFFPRSTMIFRVGEPIDTSDLAGRADRAAIAEVGRRTMASITALLAGIRGEVAPAERYDIRRGRRVPQLPAGE